MRTTIERDETRLTAHVRGNISRKGAKWAYDEIENELDKESADVLELDFAGVEIITDFSLAFLTSIKRIAQKYHSELIITEVNPMVRRQLIQYGYEETVWGRGSSA